jgi:hypothetical protein
MSDWMEFEEDLAEELGVQRVPGSGSQWHSKLDIKGKGTLWSLKCTGKEGFRIDKKMLLEAILATGGVGGTGDIPVWAVRLLGIEDFIIMRKDDFKTLVSDGSFTIEPSKSQERRNRSRVPQLLRESDGD